MKTFQILRAPEGDGSTGGGGGAPATSPSNSGLWGGEGAPTWVKETGLTETHNKTNVGQPVKPDVLTSREKPGSVAPVAPVVPAVETPAPIVTSAVAAPVAPTPVGNSIDVDKLAEALSKLQRPDPQTGQTPQLTQQQINEQLGIYNMGEEDYEAVLGVKPSSPAQLAAFNRVLQAVAKQAVTISQVLHQRSLDQQQERLNPFITSVRSQEAERQKTVFFQEHKDLVGYEALVTSEYQRLKAENRQFPDVAAARRALADQVRSTLKAAGVTPRAPATGTSPTTPSPQTGRTMTTTSVGGRGSSSASRTAPSKVEAVWGSK